MTLAEYLAQPDKSATEMARLIGVAVSTITRAAKGNGLPSRDLMQAIHIHTGGLVTPNDFFDIDMVRHVGSDTAPVNSASSGKSGDVAAQERAA